MFKNKDEKAIMREFLERFESLIVPGRHWRPGSYSSGILHWVKEWFIHALHDKALHNG